MKHNHVAIFLIAILHQVIGFIWYSPLLFLSPWLRGLGKDLDRMNQYEPVPILLLFAASIVVSYGLSWFIQLLKVDTPKRGVGLGGVVGMGFAVPILISRESYLGLSWSVIAVDALFSIVLMAVAGGILTAWPAKQDTSEPTSFRS